MRLRSSWPGWYSRAAAAAGSLVNVVIVALLGTPRFRYFGEHLTVWITYPPFVWLPAVMVLAALAGHLVIFSALRQPDR